MIWHRARTTVTRTRYDLLSRLRCARWASTVLKAKPLPPPLYQRTPPWWARWAWALVACDIFITGSIVELTWNHWTYVEPKQSTEPGPSSTVTPTQEAYVLRPVWQRLALSLTHLAIGVGAGVVLIGTQTRVIRTMTILPPLRPSPPSSTQDMRRLFIQGPHNFKTKGKIFPLASCSWDHGRDHTEKILRVDGQRGHWWLGLSDATVHGVKTTTPTAWATIAAELPSHTHKGRWVSGPAIIRR